MNKLIENAMTIEEKCENYSIGQKVDYHILRSGGMFALY